jgi:hypothetical protein
MGDTVHRAGRPAVGGLATLVSMSRTSGLLQFVIRSAGPRSNYAEGARVVK